MAREVRDNVERSRFELVDDGRVLGYADYLVESDRMVFPHTVIDPSLRGQGLGAELVRGALDQVRASGRRVEPRCWYVAQFIEEHAEYQELLAA
jgi:predicted GNAT family acetyltransferase